MKGLSSVSLACIAAVAASMAAPAGAEPTAKLVLEQSQIAFVSSQMGAPVKGTFKKFDAQIAFDPKHPEGGTIKLQIDTASATLGVPMADAELPKASWFAATRFPQATFQSSAIRALGGGKFEVAGQLSIKGSTHQVQVPATIVQTAAHDSVVTGSFTLRRLDYRIGEDEWSDTSMIGNDVHVRFKLTLTGLGAL